MSGDSVSGRFTIVNQRGLHARAATKLVQLAGKYACDVTLVGPDGEGANAKSVMGVLLLCGAMGTVVEVRATGDREPRTCGDGDRRAHRASQLPEKPGVRRESWRAGALRAARDRTRTPRRRAR